KKRKGLNGKELEAPDGTPCAVRSSGIGKGLLDDDPVDDNGTAGYGEPLNGRCPAGSTGKARVVATFKNDGDGAVEIQCFEQRCAEQFERFAACCSRIDCCNRRVADGTVFGAGLVKCRGHAVVAIHSHAARAGAAARATPT